MRDNTRRIVLICGLALLGGFFLPWVDVGGVLKISGWDMLVHGDNWALLLFPLGGLALVAAALSGRRPARGAAFFAGGGILAYFIAHVAWGFLKTTGVGLWLIIAASVGALVIALAARKQP